MLSDMSSDAAAHAKQCEDAHLVVIETAKVFQAAKDDLVACKSRAPDNTDGALAAASKRWTDAAADYNRAIAVYSALLLT